MEVGKSVVQYHDDDERKLISALTMYPTPPDEPISLTLMLTVTAMQWAVSGLIPVKEQRTKWRVIASEE